MRSVGSESAIEHRPDDATVYGLQAIANIRQGSRNNDRHGIVEKRLFHFGLDCNRLDVDAHRAVFVVAFGLFRCVVIGGITHVVLTCGSVGLEYLACGEHGLANSWQQTFLDVEKADVFGIGLDEVLATLHVFAHEFGKNFIGEDSFVDRYLQQRALLRVDGCVPQLVGVHLA